MWRWFGGDVVSSTRNNTFFPKIQFRLRETPTFEEPDELSRAGPGRTELSRPGGAEPGRVQSGFLWYLKILNVFFCLFCFTLSFVFKSRVSRFGKGCKKP